MLGLGRELSRLVLRRFDFDMRVVWTRMCMALALGGGMDWFEGIIGALRCRICTTINNGSRLETLPTFRMANLNERKHDTGPRHLSVQNRICS